MHTPQFPNFRQYDTYITRNAIFDFLKRNSKELSDHCIDIGCGRMPYKEHILNEGQVTNYVGLDIENPLYNDNSFKPDIFWDGKSIPAEENTYDSAILLEVLEHCEDPYEVVKEAYRVLKPGGKLLFSVPFLMYYHDAPYDFSRYTSYKLQSIFINAGFDIKLLEGFGGWNQSMAHFWSMWIKRSPLPKVLRFGLYIIGMPFYLLLNRKKRITNTFKTLDMVIGHCGYVQKPLLNR